MKQPLPLLIGLLVLYIIGSSFWYASSSCCLGAAAAATSAVSGAAATSAGAAATSAAAPAVAETAATVVTETNANGLAFIDNANSFNVHTSDNLRFNPSEFNYIPLTDSLQIVHQEAATYLNEHPDRTLTIVGKYEAEENNTSILASLGLARANQLKNLLLDNGASENQILIDDELVTNLEKNGTTFHKAISYRFTETTNSSDTSLEDLEERLRANPVLLYFNTNAKQLDLTDEQRQYFADLINYLNKNPSATVMTVGHTDNEGEERMNTYISRKRSQFVREHLISNGIRPEQVIAKYEGPNEPIASNATEAGRAKNRRVEIRLN